MNALLMSSISLLAAIVSCGVSLLIVYSQKWHGKHSLDHDLLSVQKFHLAAVPRIGGIAITGGILFSLGFGVLAHDYHISNNHPIAALLLASMPAFFSGITEDLTKRVSVGVRLAATIISALLASWLLGATLDGVDIWGIDSLLAIPPIAVVVTALVVAGGANAINIIDGFNGLASSVVVIMAIALGYLGWSVGDMLVVNLALLCIGTTLGFMLVNFPTGKLFLGDGGAYFLGFWVSEIAVLLLVRNPSINAWQVLSICAYPVIEVMYSIYRRKFIQKTTPGAADSLHLHTLIYSYVLLSLRNPEDELSWFNNAAVAFIVTPCIGFFAVASVFFGSGIMGAGMVVVVQVFLYLTAYKYLSRERIFNLSNVASATELVANVDMANT